MIAFIIKLKISLYTVYSLTIDKIDIDYWIHGRNIASKISPVNNIAVGGVVTRARLMQSRA